MSSPITSISGSDPVGAIRASGGDPARATGAGKPFTLTSELSLREIPNSPPREVLEQMALAGQRYDQLRTQGRELRFSHDPDSGRTMIEVRDRGGKMLKRLSPAQALAVAAGAPLD